MPVFYQTGGNQIGLTAKGHREVGGQVRSIFWRTILLVFFCVFALSPQIAGAESGSQILTSQVFPETGFTIADDGLVSFLTEFRRLGGVETLGYPVSRPYQAGGFRYQAFQRAILQWRPELARAVLANTLDWMSEQGKDDWLYLTGVPRPVADSGGSWERIIAEREGWLTEPAIARVYRAGGGMERYGLPQSRPEPRGSFTVQRFQRVALQLWHNQTYGMPAPGTVVGVLIGDLAKGAGIVPSYASDPDGQAAIPPAGSYDSALMPMQVNPEAEQVVFSLINQSRRDNGLPPVALDTDLQMTARSYATDLAARDYFSHTDPDGRGLGDRLRTAGVRRWTIALENLGYGWGYKNIADSVRTMHGKMMAETPPDDGHRLNILNARVLKVGVGVVVRGSDGNVYYVSHFTD